MLTYILYLWEIHAICYLLIYYTDNAHIPHAIKTPAGYYTILYDTILYYTVLYYTVLYYTILSTILYYSIL